MEININAEDAAAIRGTAGRINYRQVFERINKQKKDRKVIKDSLKADLEASKAWCDLREELVTLKAKIKQVEDSILAPRAEDVQEVDKITDSIKADMEMLSDLMLQAYTEGETVEIRTENAYGDEIVFEPVFKVRLKQMSLFS